VKVREGGKDRPSRPEDPKRISLPSLLADVSVAGNPNITWHTESAWGFDGTSVLPVGDSLDLGRGVMPGC